jgi:hypothetical protein
VPAAVEGGRDEILRHQRQGRDAKQRWTSSKTFFIRRCYFRRSPRSARSLCISASAAAFTASMDVDFATNSAEEIAFSRENTSSAFCTTSPRCGGVMDWIAWRISDNISTLSLIVEDTAESVSVFSTESYSRHFHRPYFLQVKNQTKYHQGLSAM